MSSQNILDDYVLQAKFAVDHGVSEHTVARYRASPTALPMRCSAARSTSMFPGAREWMAKRLRRRSPLKVRGCQTPPRQTLLT